MEGTILEDMRYDAWFLIGRTRHLMLLARQKDLRPYEISPQQAHILDVLYDLGRKATLDELAKETERGIAVVSTRLTRMERDGLVTKTRENRKSVLKKFDLTEKGVIAHENCAKKNSIKKIMSVLSEEELQQLILLMKRLSSEAEKY